MSKMKIYKPSIFQYSLWL